MDIPQAQAPTVGTNWFTDVTGEHRGYFALHCGDRAQDRGVASHQQTERLFRVIKKPERKVTWVPGTGKIQHN